MLGISAMDRNDSFTCDTYRDDLILINCYQDNEHDDSNDDKAERC